MDGAARMNVRAPLAKRVAKRWIRRLFAAGSRAASPFGKPPLPGIRILTYHRVATDSFDPFTIAPEDFRKQMEVLASSEDVVSLGQALRRMEGTGPLGTCVVLTFDDGTSDFLSAAWPVLRRLRLPATIYVNPSRVGKAGFLGWEDLRLLRDEGVEVGSHSLEHCSLGPLSAEAVRHQVRESRDILERQLSRPVDSLAYPYGTLRDFNSLVKSELTNAGYRSACTSINGMNRRGADPLALRRTKIEQGDTPIFCWILRGCLDAWSFVDLHLSGIQNRYA